MRKYRYMRYRLLACVFAGCLAAMGQTLTVQQLTSFVKSQQEFIKEGKGTDHELAASLAKVKLSEKLEEGVIEDLQGAGVGALTLKALERLREQSQSLANPKPVLPDEPIPVPTSVEQGAVLDEVRRYVANYDASLPDFICLEKEYRKVAGRPGTQYGGRAGSEPSFRQMDVITSKLTYFNHKEEKELIQPIQAGAAKYSELGGSTSTGDFAVMLRTLFEPATEARFEWNRWATLRKRLTMVFDFRVEQSRSKYSIEVKDRKLQIVTAYSGELFVDAEKHAVTRLITRAEDIPPDFPVKRTQTILDYDYTDIGGHQFLLPLYGEVQMDGSEALTKNSLEFLFYRKYEVGSAISFDMNKEISEDQLKETPAVKPPIDCKDPKNKNAPECKPPPKKAKKK